MDNVLANYCNTKRVNFEVLTIEKSLATKATMYTKNSQGLITCSHNGGHNYYVVGIVQGRQMLPVCFKLLFKETSI